MVATLSATPNAKVSSHQNPKRPPLLLSEADNGARRSKSREVTSRYLSAASSTSTTSSSATSSSYSSSSNSTSLGRCRSPLVARTVTTTPTPNSTAKRSQSVERKRPVTPRPNTNSPGEMSNAARLLVTSTRSLSISFQGEAYSLPLNKAKPAPVTVTNIVRKSTPERRKVATPLRDQAENSKPTDQRRWPGRSRQVNSASRSVDFTGERMKLGGSGTVVRALQQSMITENSGPTIYATLKPEQHNMELVKPVSSQLVLDANSANGSALTSDLAASDTESVSSDNLPVMQGSGSIAQAKGGTRGIVVPARFLQEMNNRPRRVPEPGSPALKKNGLNAVSIVPSKSIGTKKFLYDSPISSVQGVSASRGLSSPLRDVRPASPSKLVTSSTSSPSRGMPGSTRARTCVVTPSFLSFAADLRRGKMGENRVVDAHILRLMYNRHLQWRFVNAKAEVAMLVQRETAEKSLYNAWVTTLKLQHSVLSKRVQFQMLRQNLKLYSILKEQMQYLDSWDLIDRDHTNSLSGAIEALEASTLRLPVVDGARADVQNVKDAIGSAVDMMQAMASSICSLLTRVEQVNSMVSEVASISVTDRALLEQCKDLLSTLTAMQVKDCSLRTHILQLKRLPSTLTTEV